MGVIDLGSIERERETALETRDSSRHGYGVLFPLGCHRLHLHLKQGGKNILPELRLEQ